MIKGETLTVRRLGTQVTRALGASCALVSVLALVGVAAAGTAQADSFTWLGPTSLIATGGSRMLPTVSCPSTSQCTTVDGRGEEITFNPSTGAIASRSAVDAGPDGLLGVVPVHHPVRCGDNGGNETPFSPMTGCAHRSRPQVSVDLGHSLTSVSCVSGTSCTAVDGIGQEVSFNPNSGTFVGPTLIDGSGSIALSAVSCVRKPSRRAVLRCRQRRL